MGWGKSSLTEEKKKGEGGKKGTKNKQQQQGTTSHHVAIPTRLSPLSQHKPVVTAAPAEPPRPGHSSPEPPGPETTEPAGPAPVWGRLPRPCHPQRPGELTPCRPASALTCGPEQQTCPFEGRYKITSVVLLRGKVLQIPLGFSPPLSQSARKEPQKKPGVDYPPKVQ